LIGAFFLLLGHIFHLLWLAEMPDFQGVIPISTWLFIGAGAGLVLCVNLPRAPEEWLPGRIRDRWVTSRPGSPVVLVSLLAFLVPISHEKALVFLSNLL